VSSECFQSGTQSQETDPQLKKGNGMFFTPYPVVSFIVRSIHEILKEKLGKPLGLTDETVKILDPAAGTGVFLIAAARLAIDEMARIFGKEKAHTFAPITCQQNRNRL
jgi:predicted helicase